MKLTSSKKKENILAAIVALWKDTDKEFHTNPDDKYYKGRYTAALDLLKMVGIYEKED